MVGGCAHVVSPPPGSGPGSAVGTPASLGIGARQLSAGCEVRRLTEETDDSFGVGGERFVLRELLGEGSFGAVYRCSLETASGPEREYAVKVINASRIAMLVGHPLELVCPRLQREVEILKHLEHPRILKLHHAFFSEKTHRFYVVTELLKGGELFQAIIRRRRPFTEAEGRVIFSQLADAVVFCHSMGIAHRDLKLENCLFEEPNSLNVKLCDYGQAKMLQGHGGFLDTSKTLTTTPAYTAPEVAHAVQAERPYDAFKADSFGLGVILYGLLCSALPDAAKGSLYERHRRWHELSDDARDLIRRLLASDPLQRLSAQEAKGHPWLQGLDGRAGLARRPNAEASDAAEAMRSHGTPGGNRQPLEAALALQQVVVALQRERGTCCWALGSDEGEASFRWQMQHSDERLADAVRAAEAATQSEAAVPGQGSRASLPSRWADLSRSLEEARAELTGLRRRSAAQIKRRDETLDGEEDFFEVLSSYSRLITHVTAAVEASLPMCRGTEAAIPRCGMRVRLLQYAAEQLGRERAFVAGHLSRPETLRLFAVVTQLAEIIGARKTLLGCAKARRLGTIVTDAGLLPALGLAEQPPLDAEDLATLESVEERAMSSRKVDPPAVTEWWCHLTKVIDKVHQHIMVNIVESFSQSAVSIRFDGGA